MHCISLLTPFTLSTFPWVEGLCGLPCLNSTFNSLPNISTQASNSLPLSDCQIRGNIGNDKRMDRSASTTLALVLSGIARCYAMVRTQSMYKWEKSNIMLKNIIFTSFIIRELTSITTSTKCMILLQWCAGIAWKSTKSNWMWYHWRKCSTGWSFFFFPTIMGWGSSFFRSLTIVETSFLETPAALSCLLVAVVITTPDPPEFT